MDATTGSYAGAHRRQLLSSVLAFTTAFLMATVMHEGAHAVVGGAFGLHPVLHHNYVSTFGDGPPEARLWVPAAGPLVSLAFGLLSVLALKLMRARSILTLTILWLAIQGFIEFFGYVFIGAFIPDGDTGKVMTELGAPVAVRWVISIAAIAVLMLILRALTGEFERHSVREVGGVERARGANAVNLIALPVVIGAVATSLLSLPAPAFASLLYPMTSAFSTFIAYGRMRRTEGPLPEGVNYPVGGIIAQAVVLAALVANSLYLIGGVQF